VRAESPSQCPTVAPVTGSPLSIAARTLRRSSSNSTTFACAVCFATGCGLFVAAAGRTGRQDSALRNFRRRSVTAGQRLLDGVAVTGSVRSGAGRSASKMRGRGIRARSRLDPVTPGLACGRTFPLVDAAFFVGLGNRQQRRCTVEQSEQQVEGERGRDGWDGCDQLSRK